MAELARGHLLGSANELRDWPRDPRDPDSDDQRWHHHPKHQQQEQESLVASTAAGQRGPGGGRRREVGGPRGQRVRARAGAPGLYL